jgi:transcriptional regulator with XRE-family HTH domain
MQDASSRLRAFMVDNTLSQAQIAKLSGVSQSTVCRALKGKPLRRGAAQQRLFIHIKIDEWFAPHGTNDPRARIIAAFERIWNNPEAHADVIIKVIDALAGLQPPSHDQKER